MADAVAYDGQFWSTVVATPEMLLHGELLPIGRALEDSKGTYRDFYKELIKEALSISFAKDFTDEEKQKATEALKYYIKTSYKHYSEKYADLMIPRYDFILKDIRVIGSLKVSESLDSIFEYK